MHWLIRYISYSHNLKPYFLTRLRFKNPIVSQIVSWIRMLPLIVVRMDSLQFPNNQKTFDHTFGSTFERMERSSFLHRRWHSLIRNLPSVEVKDLPMLLDWKNKYPKKIPYTSMGIDYSAHRRRSGVEFESLYWSSTQSKVDMPASKIRNNWPKQSKLPLSNLGSDFPSMDYQEK